MHRRVQFIPSATCLLAVSLLLISAGASYTVVASAHRLSDSTSPDPRKETTDADSVASFQWNINDKEKSLLALDEDRLPEDLDQSLNYPVDRYRFLIFQSLNRDDETGHYLLPAISNVNKGVHFIEFASTGDGKTYVALDGSGIQLIDNGNLKRMRTTDGVRLLFIQYPDGEFRCAGIKNKSGANLDLLYAANGLTLNGVVDSFGRTVRFNHDAAGIASVTQTWMAN